MEPMIANYKVARNLLRSNLRKDHPDLFQKLEKITRVAVLRNVWDTAHAGGSYSATFPEGLEARIRAYLAGYLQQFWDQKDGEFEANCCSCIQLMPLHSLRRSHNRD